MALKDEPLYWTWTQMRQRCYNPNRKEYPDYGGRGIVVAPEWVHDSRAFMLWIERNLGPRPGGRTPAGRPEYTLDRIDNDGNYEPGNLRWATAATQGSNKRSSTTAEEREQITELALAGWTRTRIASETGRSSAVIAQVLAPLQLPCRCIACRHEAIRGASSGLHDAPLT